jgi:hypothetical protein
MIIYIGIVTLCNQAKHARIVFFFIIGRAHFVLSEGLGLFAEGTLAVSVAAPAESVVRVFPRSARQHTSPHVCIREHTLEYAC